MILLAHVTRPRLLGLKYDNGEHKNKREGWNEKRGRGETERRRERKRYRQTTMHRYCKPKPVGVSGTRQDEKIKDFEEFRMWSSLLYLPSKLDVARSRVGHEPDTFPHGRVEGNLERKAENVGREELTQRPSSGALLAWERHHDGREHAMVSIIRRLIVR